MLEPIRSPPPIKSRPLIKICGLVRAEDALHATAAGADFLGAILSDGYARSVSTEVARGFTEPTGPPLVAVLVDEDERSAVRVARASGASVLQLHGDEDPELLGALRSEGEWGLWKALRPRSPDDLRAGIERYAEHADALLLDGWSARARGGTGKRVSWSVVEAAREEMPDGTLLVLAGGLSAENVCEAIVRLRPDIVDVSSGVESKPGQKDRARVESFIRAARETLVSRGAP